MGQRFLVQLNYHSSVPTDHSPNGVAQVWQDDYTLQHISMSTICFPGISTLRLRIRPSVYGDTSDIASVANLPVIDDLNRTVYQHDGIKS